MNAVLARARERLVGRFSPGAAALTRASADDGRARSELELRRDALARRFFELQYDLGGLAYEMAIRDHFRLDVLLRRAARLQEVDGELGEAERLLKLESTGGAGECAACGSLHGRSAAFCPQCGSALMGRTVVQR